MLRSTSFRTLVFMLLMVGLSAAAASVQAVPRDGGDGDGWWDLASALRQAWSMVAGADERGPTIDPGRNLTTPDRPPTNRTAEQATVRPAHRSPGLRAGVPSRSRR